MEANRERCSRGVKRRWDADTASAARGDNDALELGVATLAGNSVGTVAAAPGTTGRDLRARVASLARIPEREVALVLQGDATPLADDKVVVSGAADADALRSAPQPQLQMLRLQRCYAISASAEGLIRLWDVSRAQCLETLTGHTKRVQCVSVDWASRRALSGSSDGTLKLWDLDTATCAETLRDYTGDFNCVGVDWGARKALGGLSNGALAMWDLSTGACVQALHGGHHGPVQCLSVSWGARKALSGSTDGGVMLWDLDHGSRVPMQGHMVWVADVTVDPHCRYAASGSIDGMLRIWDLRTSSCVRTMRGQWSDVKCIAVDWDSWRVLSGAGAGCLKFWDVGVGRLAATLRGPGDARRDINSLSADWAAGRVLSGSGSGAMAMWDINQLECLETWKGHDTQIKCVELAQGSI